MNQLILDRIEESKQIYLSDNFTLHEVLRSDKASKHNLLHEQFYPRTTIVVNQTRVIQEVLQPVRNDTWNGQPIFITSGYRHELVNKAAGGSKNSRHIKGLADDLIALNLPNCVQRRIANRLLFEAFYEVIDWLPIHSLIWEFGDQHGPQWIHISANFSGPPARRVMQAVRQLDGTVGYLPLTL